jgi:hypothetical protein
LFKFFNDLVLLFLVILDNLCVDLTIEVGLEIGLFLFELLFEELIINASFISLMECGHVPHCVIFLLTSPLLVGVDLHC